MTLRQWLAAGVLAFCEALPRWGWTVAVLVLAACLAAGMSAAAADAELARLDAKIDRMRRGVDR